MMQLTYSNLHTISYYIQVYILIHTSFSLAIAHPRDSPIITSESPSNSITVYTFRNESERVEIPQATY